MHCQIKSNKDMKLPFNIQPKRTPLQKAALRKAKELFNSNPEAYKDTMFCPYCGNPLVKSGEQRPFETTSEHVSLSSASLKDEYVCGASNLWEGRYLPSSVEDTKIGCEFGILHSWNGGFENGGSYRSDFWQKLIKMREESFVNYRVINDYLKEDKKHHHLSALNTYECRLEVEIYNCGLKNKIYLPSWLTFNRIQLTINLYYKANNFGEVTSTSFGWGFLTNLDDVVKVVGTWPWHTWRFLCTDSKRHLSEYKSCTDEERKINLLAKAMNICYNNGWVYRLHQWYMYLRHPRYAKILKKAGKYKVATL